MRLLHVKNEAVHQPAMNLQIAQVYLQHGDPALATRTWQQVMEQIASTKQGSTPDALALGHPGPGAGSPPPAPAH
ncbi:MAG: hypothetical protein V9H26_16430 [Verrucomicrobiota bacterium]